MITPDATQSTFPLQNNDLDVLRKEIERLRAQVHDSEQAVAELRRHSDIQAVQNQMLNISLQPISLTEQLQQILELILHIPWLALEEKGCIFLIDETGTSLKMAVEHNLEASLLGMCAAVPMGHCLCGRTAATQQLLFKACVDEEHDYRPAGMKPHGHYIVPIVSGTQTLGVLNLYVKQGHSSDALERDFLHTTGKLLAGIIERKMIEQKLHHLSYYDELTGLANRRQFIDALQQAIKINQRVRRHFAVLFLDLDHFKAANDQHGHDYGDQILMVAAHRMKNSVRQTDLFARLGGDEFVACINLLDDPDYAVLVAQKIQAIVSKPYTVQGVCIKIGVSIGISLYPDHAATPELLLKKADQALYHAKKNRSCIALYESSLHSAQETPSSEKLLKNQ